MYFEVFLSRGTDTAFNFKVNSKFNQNRETVKGFVPNLPFFLSPLPWVERGKQMQEQVLPKRDNKCFYEYDMKYECVLICFVHGSFVDKTQPVLHDFPIPAFLSCPFC